VHALSTLLVKLVWIKANPYPIRRERHVSVIVPVELVDLVVPSVTMFINFDRQHCVSNYVPKVDSPPNGTVAIWGLKHLVVDEWRVRESIHEVIFYNKLLAQVFEPVYLNSLVIWEQVAEAPRAIVIVFVIGSRRTAGVPT